MKFSYWKILVTSTVSNSILLIRVLIGSFGMDTNFDFLTAEVVDQHETVKADGFSNGSVVITTISNGKKEILPYHTSPVNSLDFAIINDVLHLASAGEDGVVVIYDLIHGKWKILLEIKFSVPCTSVSFSPNSDKLAIGLGDGTIEIHSTDISFELLEKRRAKEVGRVFVSYTNNNDTIVYGTESGVIERMIGKKIEKSWSLKNQKIIDLKTNNDEIAVICDNSHVYVINNVERKQLKIKVHYKPVVCLWKPLTDTLVIFGPDQKFSKWMKLPNGEWKIPVMPE